MKGLGTRKSLPLHPSHPTRTAQLYDVEQIPVPVDLQLFSLSALSVSVVLQGKKAGEKQRRR